MSASHWLPRRGLALGFLLALALATLTELDLALSAHFHSPSAGWPERAPLWRALYLGASAPAYALAVGGLVVLIGSRWRPNWVRHRRHALFFVLVVLLGPGLLVNGLLKPYWGRPRPRQVEAFGGPLTYCSWWQPGGVGAGKSFPSGHASMGFAVVAGVLLIPARRGGQRRLALAAALGYGGLVGLGRIAQGGHFFSDVLWSGALVLLLAERLAWALDLENPAQKNEARGAPADTTHSFEDISARERTARG